MNGAPARSCSASKKLSEVLSTPYTYDAAVLTDFDRGKVTRFFHVEAFQIGPVLFDLCA